MEKHKIVFMGTPEFACPALSALIESDNKPVAVYTQPPRPAGRGQKQRRSPVHELALQHDIPVLTPESFRKNPAAIEQFHAHQADLAVVAAYGLILPEAILSAPRHGCINIHASLLPRWRGASPIQHAVWKGDTQSGVTLMQMEKGLDTGPMIAKSATPITSKTTAQSLHDSLSQMGADLLIETLPDIVTRIPNTQDDSLSTYAPMLSKADGRIDWTEGAEAIDRQIRGLTPWPGTWTMNGDKRLKILAAEPALQTHQKEAGYLLDKAGLIACGGGSVLQLKTIQPEGKGVMQFGDAVNGKLLGDQLT